MVFKSVRQCLPIHAVRVRVLVPMAVWPIVFVYSPRLNHFLRAIGPLHNPWNDYKRYGCPNIHCPYPYRDSITLPERCQQLFSGKCHFPLDNFSRAALGWLYRNGGVNKYGIQQTYRERPKTLAVIHDHSLRRLFCNALVYGHRYEEQDW